MKNKFEKYIFQNIYKLQQAFNNVAYISNDILHNRVWLLHRDNYHHLVYQHGNMVVPNGHLVPYKGAIQENIH